MTKSSYLCHKKDLFEWNECYLSRSGLAHASAAGEHRVTAGNERMGGETDNPVLRAPIEVCDALRRRCEDTFGFFGDIVGTALRSQNNKTVLRDIGFGTDDEEISRGGGY